MNRDDLYEIVEYKIHEIFLEYQKSENIISGDISPDESFVLDEMKDKLTDFVIDSMKDNERGISCGQFLQDYDVKLHQIFYMMQAYWYNSKDENIAKAIDAPYRYWASNWYSDITENSPDATKDVLEREIDNVFKEYQNRLSAVKDKTLDVQLTEDEKINKLSGSEFICSLPREWQQRIKDAIISNLTEFYDTTDLDKAVDGHRSIRALAEEVMNGRLTDLEDTFDWRDVLNGGDGHYETRDEEEREI